MIIDENEDLKELFAKAKAIYLTYQLNGITYQEAKIRTKPYLDKINASIKLIAEKHHAIPKYITFQSLSINLWK